MVVLVLAMLVCVALGAVIVGYVAVEAHRDGRDMLTPQGEHLLSTVRARSSEARERGDQIRGRTLTSAQRDAE